MSTTTSYFIKPEDGWVQISSGAIGLLRVTAVPHTHPFYIANGASAPTSVDTGIQVCHKPFWFNVNDATNWWVKVVNPVQNSRRNDSSLRVDVVALNASSGGGGGTSTAYAEANVTYTAVTGGTGYSINDTIVHIVTADPTGVSGVTGNFWVNLTTGAQLASAPTLANLTLLAPAVTVAGVATAANQVTQTTALNQLHTDLIAALPAGSNTIGNVGIVAGSAAIGTVGVTALPALPTGSNTIGNVTVDGTTAGQAVSASSVPSVIASDQSVIPTTASPSIFVATPASISMAALNATVQWQVQGGLSYYLTLTNPPATTAQFVGTVTFQYSLNGSTWNTLNATPTNGPTSAVTTTATTTGLWLVQAPPGATVYIRTNMTAYTSGTVYSLLTPTNMPNASVPFPWTYTVTSGNSVTPVIDVGGFSEVDIQISAITTTILTVQGTNDPSLVTWDTIPVQEAKTSSIGTITITSTGTFRSQVGGYKWFRLQCTTTGTVLTVQGITGRMGTPTLITGFGSGTANNLTQLGGAAVQITAGNGATGKSLGVSIGSAISSADVITTAFAGSGRVNSSLVSSVSGSGAVITAEINVTAITLGTATQVLFTLQESTGGTNFTDIWVSDPVTATGIVRVPAVYVAGRRRWTAFSIGGTSTTVTATITALEMPPGGNAFIRQMRDAYAATNPFALTVNSVATTASTFVLGTLSSSTSVFNVEGTKVATAFMILGGGPTVTTQPVVTVYGSMDGTNWTAISGATLTAAGNGMYAATVANTAFKFMKLQVTTAAAYSSGSYTISNIGVNAVA